MLSYWFATPMSYWWPLSLAVGFALLGVVVVFLTLARRTEEPYVNTIATLYGVGFGLAAISEFMMYLDIAFSWSLATTFAMATGAITFFVVAAIVIAVLAIGAAVIMQYREEGSYRATHRLAH
ncbi:MAG TPA: hypothetical protein VFU60_15595 [Ktedonobacterales bacterium]|jgi:hypothetical protein|nr:hypothetical protein [Ktedonobacterales bacterium]